MTMAWETHGSGQAMVLRIRGDEQFKSPRSRAMFRTVNAALQIKDLAQKRAPTLSMDNWPDDIFPTQQERDASRLIDKVALLQNRGWSLVEEAQAGNAPSADMLVFLQEAQTVDQQLQDWKDWAPNQWRPWTTQNYSPSPSNSPATRPAMEYPKKIQLFHNPNMAGLWCAVRAARLRLLQTMLEISTIVTAGGIQLPPACSWSVLHTHLAETIDGICNSVPYLLGEVDESGCLQLGTNCKPIIAIYALWPLHAAAQVKDVDDTYFSWIMEQLQRIGTISGFKQGICLEKYRLFRRPSMLSLDPLEHLHFDV